MRHSCQHRGNWPGGQSRSWVRGFMKAGVSQYAAAAASAFLDNIWFIHVFTSPKKITLRPRLVPSFL